MGLWISCPWLPGRPSYTPEARDSVRFGLGVAGFTITDYFAKSADRIALGYFYGPAPLGYYQNAFLLYSNLLSLLTEPLHNIAVSGLSKLRGDLFEFKKSWSAALTTVSFLSSLAFALLAVTGMDFIVILLGPKWAPAGPVLCLFAIRGIAQTVERTLGWLHVSAGRSDRWMRWGLISAACQILAVIAGVPFGLIWVAATCMIATYLLFIPALVYAGRPVGIDAKDVIGAVGPQTLSGLIAVAVGFVIRQVFLADMSEIARFGISGSVCLLTYLAVVIIVFRVTEPFRLALSVLRNFRSIRFQ
jgi:PST family polysaccharide transporter